MVMRARWERGVLEKVRRVRRVRVLVDWEEERVGRRDVRKDIFVVVGCVDDGIKRFET